MVKVLGKNVIDELKKILKNNIKTSFDLEEMEIEISVSNTKIKYIFS